jgi:hypothetical protein
MAVSGLRGAPLNIAAPRKRTRFLGASAALLTVFWATALSAGGEIDIRGAEILRDGRSWES